ncbi:MAG: signaling protein consisting of a modified GGDEF domain and a DHH domain protein [Ruminococcaceae bacterium]|nr:signaling protein consisting of a modified GGDEF domain and a DHH domain protein [Oscillospiraceae bacterium]
MKPKRHFWSADTLIILLVAACAALAVLLAIARPMFLIPAAVLVLLVAVFAAVGLRRLRRMTKKLLNGKATAETAAASGLSGFSVPVVAVSGKTIIWYNEAFLQQIAGGVDCATLPLNKLLPHLDPDATLAPEGQNVALGERLYTAHGSRMRADKTLTFMVLTEDTQLKLWASEYQASRPAVLFFVIDTYDEILKELKESERAQIMANIDTALERFISRSTGFFRRVAASRYLAVVEERHLQQMLSARFDILDEVRKMDEESGMVTLSIGVGHNATSLKQSEEMAQQALDMALGRGGDQAAVYGPEGFEFYGGVTRSVEKRSKVKSRIVAKAIKDLMGQYDQVLVMGHKNSDMDSLGAAVGMLRFARLCGKPSAIVIDTETTMAGTLVKMLRDEGYGADLMPPEDAETLAGPRTLLVVVDTHIKPLLESPGVYNACGGVVVIDHHRKMVNHIDNALVFYHEPYASSASELVTELLQYVGEGKDQKPGPVEAEALLAGIWLDTRTFSLHVGVRTFEAAAYLRRLGAQTENVKRLFTSTMNEYLYRSHLVSEAKIHHGCAVAMSDKVPPEYEVVAPQAANELLGIDGVDASFVGIQDGDVVRISARSMGDVNVQVIMEKMGGGGHLTMAGAQITGVSLEQAGQMLVKAIADYREQRALETTAK